MYVPSITSSLPITPIGASDIQERPCLDRRIFLCQEVPPPGQHVPTCGPGLQHPVIRIGLSCIGHSVTVKGEINHREVLHLLWIGHRVRQVFLKQDLPALPGGLYLRHQLVQPAPFLFKALCPLGSLYCTSEKGCKVAWRERLLL